MRSPNPLSLLSTLHDRAQFKYDILVLVALYLDHGSGIEWQKCLVLECGGEVHVLSCYVEHVVQKYWQCLPTVDVAVVLKILL